MVPEGDLAIAVLAAGSGRRFGVEKQFEELVPGRRLVDVAVSTAKAVCERVVLVLPSGSTWDGEPVDRVVTGGESRIDSTRSALRALDPMPAVLVVHDAAHPLAGTELILSLVEAVRDGADAAVPIVPLVDVVKRVTDSGELVTVGRNGLMMAQAPMAFSTQSLTQALATQGGHDVWEDSMLIEQSGGMVVGVPGSEQNIHVVTPAHLELARRLGNWEA